MRVYHEEDIGYTILPQRSPDFATFEEAMLSGALQSTSQVTAGRLLSPVGLANPTTEPPVYRKIVLSALLNDVVVDKIVFVTRWS